MRKITLSFFTLLFVGTVSALDGGTLRVNTFNGWQAFEVITQGDNPVDDGYLYSMPGIFDGAGAWQIDASTLRLLVNHENFDANISEVDIDLAELKTVIRSVIDSGSTGDARFVLSARQAYDRWSANAGVSWFATSSVFTTSFRRFCSGQSYAPNTFGKGRGFVDEIYLTGEEVSNGRLFVLDSVRRDLYLLSGVVGSAAGGIGGMPFDAWENAALLDTGESNHIALLLSPDGGTQKMQLYIGEKNKNANGDASNEFLARNGLAYGSWYYLKGSFPALNNTNSGGFDTVDSGVLASDKLEDVDTSPSNPSRAVLADQTSGVFTLNFDLVFEGAFNASASSFTITTLSDNSGGLNSLNSPDNIDWTDATELAGTSYAEGLIFVNEDNSSGEIWQMSPDGSGRTLVGNTVLNAESTGILDVSALLGYLPASILITNNQGFPSSMTVLINPAATLAAAPVDALAQCQAENQMLLEEQVFLMEQLENSLGDNLACRTQLIEAQDQNATLAQNNATLATQVDLLQAQLDQLIAQQDSDGDGVVDSVDQCPDTRKWARRVAADGCAQYQRVWRWYPKKSWW